MMRVCIVLLLWMCVLESLLLSQDDTDLFRFSKHYHGGSARFEAMGGAFGALGADMGSVQINPAGMGRFSSSQINFSARLTANHVQSQFEGTSTKANRMSVSVPSIGLVLTNDVSGKNRGNMYSQFAMGMNRIDHYHYKTSIRGEQYPSLLEGFMEQAKGVEPEELHNRFPFTTSLAWESFAIDYNPSDTSYYSYLNEGNMYMSRNVETEGGIREFFLSYSVNRLNRLYWGFSFNIRQYTHQEAYTHRENLTVPDSTFIGFDYDYLLKTKGNGVNLKLGFIYLITDGWRIGVAFHSPTYISLKDEWEANMSTRFQPSGVKSVPEDLQPLGDYKYRMTTPMKTVVSMAGIVGLNLALSADIEYVDYQQAKLRSTRDAAYSSHSFTEENSEAKLRLDKGFNYRFGAEYNVYHRWFFRGGYSAYANAYKRSQRVDPKVDWALSAGWGFKIDNWSFDIAYIHRISERYYYPFLGSRVAQTHRTSANLIFTASLRL